MPRYRVHVFARVDEPDLIGTHFSIEVDAKRSSTAIDSAAGQIVGSTGLMAKRHGRDFHNITIIETQGPIELKEIK